MPSIQVHRPVIGVLPGWSPYGDKTPDRYVEQLVRGILSRARALDCDILLAWGIGRIVESSTINPAWPVVAPDSDFVPVGPWNTDGLIVLAPLIQTARTDYIQQMRAEGRPVLFIAPGESGPTIQTDNEVGIHAAIAHLVGHGHRRIAYIAGDPEDPGDSAQRYAAYQSALIEHGLEFNPRLVAYGRHNYSNGYAAMQELLQSREPFSAVQASDDISAIGALHALRDAGIQVPGQVALIGFDDQPDAAAQVPPLTSVHAPLIEIGAKAVEMMRAAIVEHAPLESYNFPASVTRRQSCGCLPDAMVLASKPAEPRASSPDPQPGLAEIEEILTNAMLASFTPFVGSQPGFDSRVARRHFALLAARILESIQQNETPPFDNAVLALLQTLEQWDENIQSFQNAISALRQEILRIAPVWPGSLSLPFAEDLIHRARAAVSESIQRVDNRHLYALEIHDFKQSLLTARLSASLSIHQVVKILQEGMPEIGIRPARVVLFEAEGMDPVGTSRVIEADPEMVSPVGQFSTRSFPPPGLYPADEALSLALVPMVFQNEPLGYIAFEASEIASVAPIARQITASLKAARLHAEVVDLSLNDELTNTYNRRYLDLFLRKEITRHQRFRRSLSIIMVDIDDFKAYNDAFGHLAGDDALKVVTQCFQSHLRETDIVARYGGDEFVVVLAETDTDGAITVARHIRDSMADQPLLMRPITLSMGIAVMADGEDSLNALIARADRVLYEAKDGGKDQFNAAKRQGARE